MGYNLVGKNTSYIGLGSNLGDRSVNIQNALKLLDQFQHIKVETVSSMYETEPVGYECQSWFINSAAEIKTSLPPVELLRTLKHIELQMGREKTVRWGPRIIDLDILLYDQLYLNTSELVIPHPRMHQRAFVLVPLSEIAPSVVHPLINKAVSCLLRNLEDKKLIHRFSE
ncbi:2-amino-4-hydroxy-6-hydroxymethyldihydropteridine diphosphokinase [Candidatus Poribacteria bacterium]|nr:2-amino-4-hydroxy-6-hydroxymethyldihydropteridine diphosphokinase [Candidatus Poribacteria bacterium]